jgi:tetratricopeptide (TPR) repeat protein
MDKNGILLSVVTLLVGFIGGFFLANSLNRAELSASRANIQPSPNTATEKQSQEPSLSPAEIKAKVDQADANPTDFKFQKDLGIGLYRYASMKQDVAALDDVARILERAASIEPKDADVLTNLGNAYFDIGFAKKDMANFEKARELYKRSLALKDDEEVRTDLGVSYYVQPQPDYAKAAAELQKVVQANPRHRRSMHFLAQVYTDQGKFAEAEKIVMKLKEISPGSNDVQDLTDQIEKARTQAK